MRWLQCRRERRARSTRPTGWAARRSCPAMPSLVPSRHEWAKDAIGGMVDRVAERSPRDHRAPRARTVQGLHRRAGQTSTSRWQGRQQAWTRAATILATGFTHFDSVNKPEWGFGTYPDVVTTTQVEQMISSGARACKCPSDGRSAGPRRHPALRRLARPPDRPRVVLQDLLHGVVQPGHGDPRGAAEDQRLHLLHGYPHLRPLRRTSIYWQSQEDP